MTFGFLTGARVMRVKDTARDVDCPFVENGTRLPCIGKKGKYLGVVVEYPAARVKLHGVKFDTVLEGGCERCCFERKDLQLVS